MKYLKYLVILFVGIGFYSCDEDQQVLQEINLERPDPFFQLLTSNVPFVAGTPEYEIGMVVIPASSGATKVKAFKTFVDASTGSESNTALLAEFALEAGVATNNINTTVNFAQLREGLQVDGSDLSTDEFTIAIGSKWTISYEIVNDADEIVLATAKTTGIAVLSPFAGDYVVIEDIYYRAGVLSTAVPWEGETRFIGSVNDTTFSHPGFMGGFTYASPDIQFVFYLDKANNTFRVPATVDGETQPITFGEHFVSCSDLAVNGNMDNAMCGVSNVLIPDPVDGKHRIIISYGYYANASQSGAPGTREFYEVLEKIVE